MKLKNFNPGLSVITFCLLLFAFYPGRRPRASSFPPRAAACGADTLGRAERSP